MPSSRRRKPARLMAVVRPLMRLGQSNRWKTVVVAIGATTALMLFCNGAVAMTFDVMTVKGEPAIFGHGEITAGDATRLRSVLTPKAKHSYGYYSLVLESPGGSVQAAFELSRVIDSQYVNTYVAPGINSGDTKLNYARHIEVHLTRKELNLTPPQPHYAQRVQRRSWNPTPSSRQYSSQHRTRSSRTDSLVHALNRRHRPLPTVFVRRFRSTT